jgi:hypothetical protein
MEYVTLETLYLSAALTASFSVLAWLVSPHMSYNDVLACKGFLTLYALVCGICFIMILIVMIKQYVNKRRVLPT